VFVISLSIGSESATREAVPRLMLWNIYIGGRWIIATQNQGSRDQVILTWLFSYMYRLSSLWVSQITTP
jgi:hypothetical protein